MGRRGKIVRMDEWDKESVERYKGKTMPKCDFTDTLRLHSKHGYLYDSLFKRNKEGIHFDTIKQNEGYVCIIAESACRLLDCLFFNMKGWCIGTTSRRRFFRFFVIPSS